MSQIWPARIRWPASLVPRGTIWLCPTDAASLERLAPWLTGRDWRASRRFQQHRRRQAMLIGRALLRHALDQQLQVPVRPWQFRLQASRRPLHLHAPWARRFALSLSHTERWVGVAVLPGAHLGWRVGLDLEAADRKVDPRIARRLPGDTTTRADRLLQAWTHAEAALKADGRGLSALGRLHQDGPGSVATDLFRIRTAALSGLPGFPAACGAVAVARPVTQTPSR